MQHASKPPSGANIWGNCSAGGQYLALCPNSDTAETLAGTASHWVWSESLTHDREPNSYLGERDPDNTLIDTAMVEGAQGMLTLSQDYIRRYPDYLRHVETRVHMPQIHNDNWGTCDFSLVKPDHSHFITVDYKSGRRSVSVKRCLQLVDYALGFVNLTTIGKSFALSALPPLLQGVRFTFVVYQPFSYDNCGPVKVWETTADELLPIWYQLHTMAHAEPAMTTGRHCRDCPRVMRCSAARKAGYNLMDYVEHPPELDDMDNAALGLEYDTLTRGMDLLKGRISDLHDELQARVHGGQVGTGYALQTRTGRSKSKWLHEDATVITALGQLGLDIDRGQTAVTPAQALTKAKTQEQRDLIKTLRQPSTTYAELVRLEDHRAASTFQNQE